MPALNFGCRERRGCSHRQVHLEIIPQVSRNWFFADLSAPRLSGLRMELRARGSRGEISRSVPRRKIAGEIAARPTLHVFQGTAAVRWMMRQERDFDNEVRPKHHPHLHHKLNVACRAAAPGPTSLP